MTQGNRVHGIEAEGVCTGVFAHPLVDLAATDHDLPPFAQAGVLDRLNRIRMGS
jgi:hypothetical protein